MKVFLALCIVVLAVASVSAGGRCRSGVQKLTDPSGTLKFPPNGDEYSAMQDCFWLIDVPNAVSVSLTVDEIDTEDGYDYLYFYDGNVPIGPYMQRLAGSTAPSSPVTAGSGQMLIYFHVDQQEEGDGFELSWTTQIASDSFTRLDNTQPVSAVNISSAQTYGFYADSTAQRITVVITPTTASASVPSTFNEEFDVLVGNEEVSVGERPAIVSRMSVTELPQRIAQAQDAYNTVSSWADSFNSFTQKLSDMKNSLFGRMMVEKPSVPVGGVTLPSAEEEQNALNELTQELGQQHVVGVPAANFITKGRPITRPLRNDIGDVQDSTQFTLAVERNPMARVLNMRRPENNNENTDMYTSNSGVSVSDSFSLTGRAIMQTANENDDEETAAVTEASVSNFVVSLRKGAAPTDTLFDYQSVSDNGQQVVLSTDALTSETHPAFYYVRVSLTDGSNPAGFTVQVFVDGQKIINIKRDAYVNIAYPSTAARDYVPHSPMYWYIAPQGSNVEKLMISFNQMNIGTGTMQFKDSLLTNLGRAYTGSPSTLPSLTSHVPAISIWYTPGSTGGAYQASFTMHILAINSNNNNDDGHLIDFGGRSSMWWYMFVGFTIVFVVVMATACCMAIRRRRLLMQLAAQQQAMEMTGMTSENVDGSFLQAPPGSNGMAPVMAHVAPGFPQYSNPAMMSSIPVGGVASGYGNAHAAIPSSLIYAMPRGNFTPISTVVPGASGQTPDDTHTVATVQATEQPGVAMAQVVEAKQHGGYNQLNNVD